MSRTVVRSDQTRMFYIPGGAHPSRTPEYAGFSKVSAITYPQGDVTRVYLPSDKRYGQFDVVDTIQGEPGTPQFTVMTRSQSARSAFLAMARAGCTHDVRLHFGKCASPTDGNGGWDRILALLDARITSWDISDVGALSPDERANVVEETPFQGLDLIEILPVAFSNKAATDVAREVVGVYICDSIQCGECGVYSDGCQIILAVTKSSDASVGLVAEVVFSTDGGLTWSDVDITSIGVAEDPNDIACIGSNVVVISSEAISLSWANLSQMILGTHTWTEVQTGFVQGPRAIFSYDPTHTWIVGAAGYVYFTDDPTAGVDVQDAGVATAQQLNDIHGIDTQNLVAVGASNAVILTENGGLTWSAVTGPAVGVALNAVWMLSKETWLIGTAGGKLYYTKNQGATWTEITFSGSGSGSVRAIAFVNKLVGYMSHSTSTPAGRIFRTIDGGASWFLMPDGGGTMPASDYIGALAVCTDSNVVVGGGLADDATDGVIIKGS